MRYSLWQRLPAAALAPDSPYTITFGTGLQNLTGKPLQNAFVWNFRTRPIRAQPLAGQGPYVQDIYPTDFSTGVNLSNQITIYFSEAMDVSALTASTAVLQSSDGTMVPCDVSCNSSGYSLIMTPTALLDSATQYVVTLSMSEIQSAAATPQTLQGNATFTFTTMRVDTSGNIIANPDDDGSGTGGTPDPSLPPPVKLHLNYGEYSGATDNTPDTDAGATVTLKATLPDGSVRQQKLGASTFQPMDIDTPEYPGGTTFEFTPEFQKGSDPDVSEEQKEIYVTGTPSPGYERAMANYIGLVAAADGTGTPQVVPSGTPPTAWVDPSQNGGTTSTTPQKAALLSVNVNINNTAETKDDIVRKEQKIGTSAWHQWIPCTVNIAKSAAANTISSIGVTAESGTMKFSDAHSKPGDIDAGAANVNVTLDAQGQAKFWITGITQSANIGDAKLQIRKNGATGDLLITMPMTVFWFDARIIFASQVGVTTFGTSYGLEAPQQSWTFSGEAMIKPTGLDSTAPQIAKMKLCFIQNVKTTRNWYVKTPAVQPGSGAPSTATVTVATTRVGTVSWQSYVLDRRSPQSTVTMDQTPLYDGYNDFDASGKSTIDNDDAPSSFADVNSIQAQAVQANQNWPVNVEYQWDKTVIQDDFLLWLGVTEIGSDGWLPNPPSVTPIRQVDWHLHADSSTNGLQTPNGGTHKDPDIVPVVTGQTANQQGASRSSYQWQSGNQSTNLHP